MPGYVDRYHANIFDSVIDYKDLTLGIHDYVLTLKLNVFLNEMKPPAGKTTFTAYDSGDGSATAQQWNANEWEHFRKEFKRQSYAAWNYAFVLIPPASYNGFVDPSGVRRNVQCFLQINLRDRPGIGTHTVDCYSLTETGGMLRANSGLLTNKDVAPTTRTRDHLEPMRLEKKDGKMRWSGGNPDGKSFAFKQSTIAHEVGHLLGLGHIADHTAACKHSGPNSSRCYGLFLKESMNIMGGGDALSIKNSTPWRERITKHARPTEIPDWKVDFATSEARLRGLWSLRSW
jgi:hypothetical protein